MNKEGVQLSFGVDSNSEFYVAEVKPTWEEVFLTMDSTTLVEGGVAMVRASQQEFYDRHPELHGESAYYHWLAQASDY